MAILSAIAKERGRAVLVVTHDPRLFRFADSILHIEDGSLTGDEFTDREINLERRARDLDSAVQQPRDRGSGQDPRPSI